MAKEMDNLEIWKRIPDSDKFYEVSNFGRIRNGITGKILTPRPTPKGYLRIHISVGNGRKDFYIHRLVAAAFCPNPQGYNTVNHLDNNITNNNASNLEWCTQAQNIDYCHAQNRALKERIPVIGTLQGKEYFFESIYSAAKATGCYTSDISRCCRGLREEANGYKWRCAT